MAKSFLSTKDPDDGGAVVKPPKTGTLLDLGRGPIKPVTPPPGYVLPVVPPTGVLAGMAGMPGNYAPTVAPYGTPLTPKTPSAKPPTMGVPYVYTSAPAAGAPKKKTQPLWGTPSGGTPAAQPTAFITPERVAQDRLMMSQADWLTKYGNVNFDINAIKSIFDAATNAEYAAKDREYAATERKFYDQKGTEQQSLLDAKRRAAAQNAVQTGANRGMQNAMQLTDTIQQSAAAAPDALTLAEGRRALIDQQQAALMLNAKEAEALAEQRKLDYAKVGSEIYATDAQKYVGELGYDAAALESAMTKYGIDRSQGGGAQQITQPTISQASIIQQQGAYRQLYAKAQASGDTATAQMAASMLGLLAMQAGG